MGKTLVHRAKMVLSTPEDGDPESVYAAALPRSAVVQGTFQVTKLSRDRNGDGRGDECIHVAFFISPGACLLHRKKYPLV